jgi:hypothetical protein
LLATFSSGKASPVVIVVVVAAPVLSLLVNIVFVDVGSYLGVVESSMLKSMLSGTGKI